jgi:anti-anti-sigma factor
VGADGLPSGSLRVGRLMDAAFIVGESVHEGHAYLALAGHVNFGARRAVRERVQHYLRCKSVRGIVVSLASATFIDPNGLGVLLACRRRTLDANKTFRVSSFSDRVASILAAGEVMSLLDGSRSAVELAELP